MFSILGLSDDSSFKLCLHSQTSTLVMLCPWRITQETHNIHLPFLGDVNLTIQVLPDFSPVQFFVICFFHFKK